MSGERHSTTEALKLRLQFERLFGIQEVYVGKRTKATRAAALAAGKAKSMPAGKLADESSARTRRREAVEAARRRTSDAARAREAAKNPSPEPEAPPAYEFVIETIGGSHDEGSLLSDAERAGIPHVSVKLGSNAERLAELAEAAASCTRCGLAAGRTNVVFGEGNPNAKLVFVGEAPGEKEDLTGHPFVGRAGKLLTKIIEEMGYAREDVFICNVLKSRPPKNRNPLPNEVVACSPFLHEQLAVIKPKAICALGAPASHTLLKTREAITRLRGRLFWYRGIPLMPTFHPAYLLRSPTKMKEVREDMKKLKAFIESLD